MPEVSKTRRAEFAEYYGRGRSRAERLVEREVFGTNAGISSYTTPEQADELAELLDLGPATRLLDIGSGVGWPALYLVERAGCSAVLTDVPAAAVRAAAQRATHRGLRARSGVAVASGTHPPLRRATFDAVLLSDVL